MLEFASSGILHEAMRTIAAMSRAELIVRGGAGPDPTGNGGLIHRPIRLKDAIVGDVCAEARGDARDLEQAASAVAALLEHATSREIAVEDLADQLMANYDELNMLYALMPTMATKVHEDEIGATLVDWAAQTLHCRRVSMLVLDEDRKHLRVLAARGLPEEIHDLRIPLSADTIAGRTISMDDLLVVSDISERPELMELSRGSYDTTAFAVIRVPLQAHGEAVGVLTATERLDGDEFTARDCKLLEGLSAMGASALVTCRLHAAGERQMMNTIKALAMAVDAKDHYTHDHSGRVARLSVATARQLGITDAQALRNIELAGFLHDIGKIGIPDAILAKSSALTDEEFAVIKTHARIGAGIVEKVDGLEDVARAILHHHERHDGRGYPAGLRGEEIPLASRLIAVVDAFDSLTSDRTYRAGTTQEIALAELHRCRGTQFDPAVLDAFCTVLRESEAVTATPQATAAL